MNDERFSLISIKNEDKDNVFLRDKNRDSLLYNENYFTLITGENGCGKSSLLAKAINSFIFDGSNRDVNLDYNSLTSPARVIAICNSRYNRFPLKDTYIKRGVKKQQDYYIQVEHNLEIGKSVLSVVGQCLRKRISDTINLSFSRHFKDIESAFGMIGLESFLRVKLKKTPKSPPSLDEVKNKFSDYIHSFDNVRLEDVYNKFTGGPHSHEMFMGKSMRFDDRNTPRYRIPFLLLDIENNNIIFEGVSDYDEEELFILLILELVIPDEIQVKRVRERKLISNHQLSSGQ